MDVPADEGRREGSWHCMYTSKAKMLALHGRHSDPDVLHRVRKNNHKGSTVTVPGDV
ncbi:uncharacterized protein STEHIDRAFT_122860 [Stereum hirsutum FP-91666 SS1]|uniref:uncharacterized protein n=1 Tax=Stereum hirsutum (strain FP-91666) TaxID=721885 RepID=UPI000444955A|nr:uncharacterized protein STEHIDRAFT_122860 [Stereum hirsutum FP-91666 SS1]EIM84928.1 hypothetical protein STEHIDRAFT_122860 [Stereum hirsutum FP-91666 SS1]